METADGSAKSFGPKLFPSDEPSAEWGVDELGAYAHLQEQAIVDGERSLALVYWRQGLALVLAKQNFDHGQWTKYLDQWGISKARAARAMAIYSTFKDQSLVLGLTVEAAYERRERKQRRRTARSKRTNEGDALKSFVAEAEAISRRAEALVDAAAFASKTAADELLPVLTEAIRRLERLRACLAQADQS